MPFAVVTYADFTDRAAAEKSLQELLPTIRAATGFVRGVWLRGDDSTGLAVLVFDTKEIAETAAAAARERSAQGMPGVTLNRVEVREVAAEA